VAVNLELQLREGEAYIALDSVRHAVKYAMCLRANKCKHAKCTDDEFAHWRLVREAEE